MAPNSNPAPRQRLSRKERRFRQKTATIKFAVGPISHIIGLLLDGKKVSNHNGYYVRIDGKRFYSKHFRIAKAAMFQVREDKRKAKAEALKAASAQSSSPDKTTNSEESK